MTMIEVNDLKFNYRKELDRAVDGISFHVAKGEVLGFLGPSGAGKSTTQKILIRLLKNYSGQVRIFGKEISEYNDDFYNRIGVGFELPNHYPRLTAIENLRFFASFYACKTIDPHELLKMVGLEDDGHKKAADFSKGMKMRLNFVRAIMHKPPLLFLDEPTSGLDPVNARKIKDIIKRLALEGTTIFLTTHNMHDADELCDRVAFISRGKIALIDAPHTLKLAHGSRLLNIEYGRDQAGFVSFPLEGLGDNIVFQELIKSQHIKSMHSAEASLEDVFIKTTGESLN